MLKKLFFLGVFIISPVTGFTQDRITGRDFATRSEVIAQNGMAATKYANRG